MPFQTKQVVELLASKRDLQTKRVLGVFQAWRAEDKGTIVAINFSEHDTLQTAVEIGALIEQRLDQTKRSVIIEIVNELDITLQFFGDFAIERLEACTRSLLAQEIVLALNRAR